MLERGRLSIREMDVIELNEAFAAQVLAVIRELGLADDAAHLNPTGGAIALGHPLGASGARLLITAIGQLRRRGLRYALCSMCIGVGQGISVILERAWLFGRRWRLWARVRRACCCTCAESNQ